MPIKKFWSGLKNAPKKGFTLKTSTKGKKQKAKNSLNLF